MREQKYSIAETIKNLVQQRVYGSVIIEQDIMRDSYILHIRNPRGNEEYHWYILLTNEINEIFYQTGYQICPDLMPYYKLVDYILDKYRNDILGRYLI